MHTRLKCAALLLLVAPLGCRSQGELDLAERDMRLQENRIYKLQEYIQQYQHMLEDCQAENESLRKQLASDGKTPDTRSAKPRTLRELMNSNNNRSSKPTTTPEPAGREPATPDFSLPVTPSIDLGTEFDPDNSAPAESPVEKPAFPKTPNDNFTPDPSATPPAGPGELPEPDEIQTPAAGDATRQKATQLAIRAVGQVRGNVTMPGGLLVVIEPRGAQGGIARAPEGAKMSLMIVAAPTEEPQGRWDYTAEQTNAAYRAGFGADNGWRFVLPFNKAEQPADRYKLYARLVLPDGSKLISDREFDAEGGASVEELPSGDAGWFHSQRPIASLANRIGREARMIGQDARRAFGGEPPKTGAAGSARGPRGATSGGGNTAPAWQPGESAPASTPSAAGGTAPPFNPAPDAGWDLKQIPTAPTESKVATEPTTGPAAETAAKPDRPAWSPYR